MMYEKPGTLPRLFIVLVTSGAMLATAGWIIAPRMNTLAYELLTWGILLGAVFLLTRYLGWEARIGLQSPGNIGSLPLFIIPVIALTLPPLVAGISAWPARDILCFIILALVVGCTIEMVFRGLIQEYLSKWGIHLSVLGSALLYGVYSFGFFFSTVSITCALGAMVYLSGIGICLAALRLRSGSLWPLIGLHAWAFFISLFGDHCTDCVLCLIPRTGLGLLWAGYGLLLLRGYRDEPAPVQIQPEK